MGYLVGAPRSSLADVPQQLMYETVTLYMWRCLLSRGGLILVAVRGIYIRFVTFVVLYSCVQRTTIETRGNLPNNIFLYRKTSRQVGNKESEGAASLGLRLV